MKKVYIIKTEHKPIRKEDRGSYATRLAESLWTMNNGLVIRITYWTFIWGDGTTTRQVGISPWGGYYDMSFVEVQECLWQVLNSARSAINYRDVQIEI